MHHIIIGTDSRGAYFEGIIKENTFPNGWEVHIDVAPGGTIKTIANKLLPKIKTLPVKDNSQILIMIAGGICNLAVKKRLPWGGYTIRYPDENRFMRTESVREEVKQAVEAFTGYNVVLKFATIPPASIVKVADYFSYTFPESQQQAVSVEQKHLEIDIDLINSFITSVNLANGTKTVRWDKDLLKSHSKRRGTNKRLIKLVHYRYVDLYDGLHPHMALSQTWCSIMCKSISSDLPTCNSESTEEEYEVVVTVEEEEMIVEIVEE